MIALGGGKAPTLFELREREKAKKEAEDREKLIAHRRATLLRIGLDPSLFDLAADGRTYNRAVLPHLIALEQAENGRASPGGDSGSAASLSGAAA